MFDGKRGFDDGTSIEAHRAALKRIIQARGREQTHSQGDGHLVAFGDGDAVGVSAEAEAVRFLLVSGKPIGEPIAWYGPIVMNTQEELRVAFEQLDRGTFIKDRSGAR